MHGHRRGRWHASEDAGGEEERKEEMRVERGHGMHRHRHRQTQADTDRHTGLDSRLPNWTVPMTETRIMGSAASWPGTTASGAAVKLNNMFATDHAAYTSPTEETAGIPCGEIGWQSREKGL